MGIFNKLQQGRYTSKWAKRVAEKIVFSMTELTERSAAGALSKAAPVRCNALFGALLVTGYPELIDCDQLSSDDHAVHSDKIGNVGEWIGV